MGEARPSGVLLLFVDGVGLGDEDAEVNPLVAAHLPALKALLNGARLVSSVFTPNGNAGPNGAAATAADACLGVPGRPQSGTGQVALLCGMNAPARFGRHFGPWVPTPLRPLHERHNLLSVAARAGRTVAFANAYPADFLTGPTARRPAAPPLAARAAGLPWRDHTWLRDGRAVASGITNEAWRRRWNSAGIPEISAHQAGTHLAEIASAAELTLFAHYTTDLAGHQRDMPAAVAALERFDAFLAGLLAALPARVLLVIASDHGNIEDVRRGHTRNPVPVIARGSDATQVIRRIRSTADVAPAVLNALAPGSRDEPAPLA